MTSTTRGAAAAAVVVLLSAGCSHGSHPALSPRSSTTDLARGATTAAPSTAGTTTATSAGAPTTTTSVAARPARCVSADFGVTLTTLGAAAGTEYLELDLKNKSARSCTVQGYPGVSFVDGRGHQIGVPAERMNGVNGPVTVAPGAAAGALIAYHDALIAGDNCRPTTAAGIRVYPPNETASIVVAAPLMVCANPALRAIAGVSPVATPASLHP